jgi:UDPglucose 6-dehydrogenase
VVAKLREMLGGDLKGKEIGVLGLAFKPNTDDMRDAPSIPVIEELVEAGARVRGYDPVAMDVARQVISGLDFCSDPYSVASGCDALVIMTEWNEFKNIDLNKLKDIMRQPIVVDGRNVYDPAKMQELGFHYRGIGRGYNGSSTK